MVKLLPKIVQGVVQCLLLLDTFDLQEIMFTCNNDYVRCKKEATVACCLGGRILV